MPVDPHANFAYSTVATAPSPASSGTSLVVASGDGARFPAASFNATVWPAGSAPTAANAEIVRVTAVSTDTFTITRAQESTSARSIGVGDQIAATVTAKTLTDVEQAILAGFFGDGSDGNVTITSGTTTLTRDMLYDTLTVQNGGILKTAGYRVYCKTALVVDNGGKVHNDGNPGSGTSGGGAVASGSIGGSTAGASGTTTAGASSSGNTISFGGRGGAGGNGAGNFGGNSGNAAAPAATAGNFRSLPMTAIGHVIGVGFVQAVNGGTGGGGGGGDGTNSGRGGGGGAGALQINAKTITNNGTISANGGAGVAAIAGNSGGGGGGGGGVVFINTTSYTGNAATATGGNGGAGFGTGTAGATGSAGNVFNNVWG